MLDLPTDTMEHMLHYEIFPVLWTNFLDITGEWIGWDEDWLADQVEKRRENPGNLLYRGWMWLWWRYYEGGLMEHWNGIKKWWVSLDSVFPLKACFHTEQARLLFDKDDKVWSDKDTKK